MLVVISPHVPIFPPRVDTGLAAPTKKRERARQWFAIALPRIALPRIVLPHIVIQCSGLFEGMTASSWSVSILMALSQSTISADHEIRLSLAASLITRHTGTVEKWIGLCLLNTKH